MPHTEITDFNALNIAVLTVSDSRTEADDRSGAWLKAAAVEAGHRIADRRIVKDRTKAIRAAVQAWIENPAVDAVLTTGGTGFRRRDVTPEAVEGLLERRIPGFGELFRMLSYQEIGASTVQSRAFAGIAGQTLIFCLPGSTGACRTAWNRIIRSQLDSTHRPCNFVEALQSYRTPA